jgi:hypothetical protein
MANSRLNVIDEAFNKLDANKDGVLSIEDFRVHYDNQAKLHPKYINGEWTKDQVLEIDVIFTSYNKSNLYINRYYKAFLMHSILQANETVL